MARKEYSPKKIASIEAFTRFIRFCNRLLCVGLAVSFGALIAATAFPQKRQLEALEEKLRSTQAREELALAAKEHREIQLHALREDTAFLEVQARDRLNYYRPGERVLRFDRDR